MGTLKTPCSSLTVLWVIVKYVQVHYGDSRIVPSDSVMAFSLQSLGHMSDFTLELHLLTLSRHVFGEDVLV